MEDHKSSKKTEKPSDLEPWSVRKSAILSKFTTSEKLTMVSSFLSGGEKGESMLVTDPAFKTVALIFKDKI